VRPRRFFPLALAGPLLALACAVGAAAGSATPIPAPPQRWLTDEAGLLSPQVAEQLDARLQAYEQSSGHQIVVYIGKTTGVVPIEDWAVKAFESWRVGRKELDDGLALIVMAEDHRVRIEVGYGLEGQVPDALAARVINDELVPRMQQGDNDGAVSAAVDRLIRIISGEGAAGGGQGETDGGPVPTRPMTLTEKILIGIGILGFLLLLVTNPALAIYLLFSILSGGRGGDGGGRGGFSGGGGRSGGGGASGSW
jgi:uncharacterized protein